ncbi:DeoR/GlpR family DNA-binding transcription regulator [Parasalinivibrio latis]|uniref:DeoR/GlpR family DNA-binding transcription regulator n=1 Tax=Parasalinivibrio latis TaxID=2952610 RepID=UPI0030E3CA1E
MKVAQREQAILSMLQSGDIVTVEEMAKEFSLSKETVRRDLARMAAAGTVRKVYGGAVLPQTAMEDPVDKRRHSFVEEKDKIARTVIELFKPGDSLFIDTGTTTSVFAQYLSGVDGVTVITNSADVADCFNREQQSSKAILVGGDYNARLRETYGPMAVRQIRAFHADWAVVTVGGVHSQSGLTDYNLEEAEIARAMIAQSRRVVILADHSKVDCEALVQVCGWDNVDYLVTDSALPKEYLAVLADKKVTVLAG